MDDVEMFAASWLSWARTHRVFEATDAADPRPHARNYDVHEKMKTIEVVVGRVESVR